MMSTAPCVKCNRLVDLRDIAWFYTDDKFECRSCRYGLLLDEAATTFWKAYNAESAICAMGAARGQTLEWIRNQARKAMLMREWWLLASGDGV